MISPGLDRSLLRIGGRPAAALDRRLADPILEAEGRPAGRKLIAVLPPDQLDTGKLVVGAAGRLHHGLKPGRVRREAASAT